MVGIIPHHLSLLSCQNSPGPGKSQAAEFLLARQAGGDYPVEGLRAA
jgi:hypothetical protein